MKCPYCGDEMIRGYLMSSRDITFAVDNLTKVFRIKKSDDLELSKVNGGVKREKDACFFDKYSMCYFDGGMWVKRKG